MEELNPYRSPQEEPKPKEDFKSRSRIQLTVLWGALWGCGLSAILGAICSVGAVFAWSSIRAHSSLLNFSNKLPIETEVNILLSVAGVLSGLVGALAGGVMSWHASTSSRESASSPWFFGRLFAGFVGITLMLFVILVEALVSEMARTESWARPIPTDALRLLSDLVAIGICSAGAFFAGFIWGWKFDDRLSVMQVDS